MRLSKFLIAAACVALTTMVGAQSSRRAIRLADLGVVPGRWNPLLDQGLRSDQIDALVNSGWKTGITSGRKEAYMLFKSSDVPGGVALWRTRIEPGKPFIYDPRTGYAVKSDCGNPTCWRWLVDDEVPHMRNEGAYDPARFGVLPSGIGADERARLLAMGWKEATTPAVRKDVEMAAPSPVLPGQILLRKFDVPAGSPYLYNPTDGRAILEAGGNATAWEWLAKQRSEAPILSFASESHHLVRHRVTHKKRRKH